MKRFILSLIAICFALPVFAQAPFPPGRMKWAWESAVMRNTTAASNVVRNANWAAQHNASGFTDSVVFRRGATTMTVYDTTMGYATVRFAGPPSIGAFTTQTDSTQAWLIVRVVADTTSGCTAGCGMTSGMDSVRVAFEYSYNGVAWFSCSGTPTYRFDTIFMTSGQDGLQSPTLIGVEGSPGEDAVLVPYKWVSGLLGAQAFIVNKQLPFAGSFIRAIIGGDYSGQFSVQLGYWVKD